MLGMIDKVVMYIVLDQNGITNFTDAFKISVDQIVAGLEEVEGLRVENEELSVVCEYQEKQLLERGRVSENVVMGVSLDELREHKKVRVR
jgi:hypothetical protein